MLTHPIKIKTEFTNYNTVTAMFVTVGNLMAIHTDGKENKYDDDEVVTKGGCRGDLLPPPLCPPSAELSLSVC